MRKRDCGWVGINGGLQHRGEPEGHPRLVVEWGDNGRRGGNMEKLNEQKPYRRRSESRFNGVWGKVEGISWTSGGMTHQGKKGENHKQKGNA